MSARLLCKAGDMKGSEFSLEAETTIGRSRSNSIVLNSSSISGSHARIHWSEERETYTVEDLGSMNGTELDGVPVRGEQRLGRLHVLTFGKSLDFIFVTDGLPPGVEKEVATEAEAAPEPPKITVVDLDAVDP